MLGLCLRQWHGFGLCLRQWHGVGLCLRLEWGWFLAEDAFISLSFTIYQCSGSAAVGPVEATVRTNPVSQHSYGYQEILRSVCSTKLRYFANTRMPLVQILHLMDPLYTNHTF
jgi:hypothetical protein